ncbi:translocation/assembly module TamB domain-containing protein [Lyngbya confervoides]|uniref:Translocation/assembly module TamB domain-containing protein n=1 Tax=Lyngbya confervoides BDU141951 TaxID=1574623 RepID=A0ABD4SZF9_9CYAN|nr:translocation/assembly module TamB domain-containing protein [Lyngbya confervoides]MCM1981653.1 translocation/assembly module TamB domain-containing protein [Lyngbya confervoides BDU141951]
MSNSETNGPASGQRSRRFFSKSVLATAGTLGAAALAGGGWFALKFVQEDLAPTISSSLSESLNRPVQLGDLQGMSLTGLEFGRSEIPPHPYPEGRSGIDSDSVTVEAVRVRFDLWKTLLTRTLNLDVTLVEPQVYVNQTENGLWLETQISPPEEEGWLKTQLDRIQVDRAAVTLEPFGGSALQLENLNGAITLRDDNQKVNFNLTSALNSGGQGQVQGQWLQPSQTLTLKAKTKDVAVVPLLGFVPDLPLTVRSGQVSGDFDLKYQPQEPLRLKAKGQIDQANVQIQDPQIQLAAETVDADLQITYRPNALPILAGTAQIKDASAGVPEDLILQTGRSRLQRVDQVNGMVKFLPDTQRMQFDLKAKLPQGGVLNGEGVASLDLEETNLLLRAQGVPAPLLDRAYALPINVRDGRVNANLLIKLREEDQPYLKGWAQLQNVDAAVTQMPRPFFDATGFIQVEGLTANLNQVRARYGQIPLVARGTIDPDRGYDLAVRVPPTEINQALRTLQVESLPFPLAGQIEVPNLRVGGRIADPVLTGTVQNQGRTQIDRVPFQAVSADFRLVLPNLQVQNIQARPLGGGTIAGNAAYRITPEGRINALLRARDLPGDAIAQRYGASADLRVGPVAAQIRIAGRPTNPLTTVNFQAPQALYATRGQVLVQGGEAQLRNVISQVAQGEVVTNGLIRDLQLAAQVEPRGLVLSTFSPDLRGLLNGSVEVRAPLTDFSARTLRAEGRLNFSEGISLIEAPIDSRIAWNGQQIIVRNASAPGFRARGVLGADVENLQITTLDLGLSLEDFSLSRLAALGPTAVELGGTADLNGQLSGTLTSPRLRASLAVDNLAVAQVPFEDQMRGSLTYQPTGVDLTLAGNRDRIQVALAEDFLPNRFWVKRDDAIAQGDRRGDTLVASVEQFPLQLFNLRPAADFGFGPVGGLAFAEVTANLNTLATAGSFTIQQPSLGTLVGDRASGQFQYRQGLARIMGAELQKRDSTYRLSADLRIDEDPDVRGTLAIDQGQVADLVYIAQGFGSYGSALGTAQDLQIQPVGDPDAPLLMQLQRLAEVQEILAEAEDRDQQAPPSLAELTGILEGQIAFSGSAETGVAGSFDLLGSDFRWGQYSLDNAVAKGRVANGGVEFEPLRLASGDRIAQYTGSLGIIEQSGRLVLSQVPIDPLNQLLDLPVTVTGNLNGVAVVGGNLLDPTLSGELSLAQGQVSQMAINQAEATFNYEQARLLVEGLARLDNPEPVRLKADIPYALPFAASFPSSDQIAVDISVKDEGLGLVSLFTDQVNWVDGDGSLDIQVRGTLDQPLLNGAIALQNTTLTTPNIEDPITAVKGTIRFDQSLVRIARLEGRHDQGTVWVSGTLPISGSAPDTALRVSLEDLDLKLKNLYDGEVEGTLLVTGSVLEPNLGGSVRVQNGKVVLSEVASMDNGNGENGVSPADPGRPIAFDQLQVTLGDRVRISQPPVLSFVAAGDLVVNGDLSDPQPEGTIFFQNGTINLFTSRFRTDPRRQNVAIFDPRYGVDPYLNLGMRSTVFEVVQGRTSKLSDFETVPASSLGSVESVRVYAEVDGRASELQTNFQDVVQITSDPPRSEGEIIALLGGGISDEVQSGQVETAALNVASSALLGNVQDLLAGVLGNRATVNAFPVLLPNKDNDRSVLAFGAEISYDVTDRLSVSALQILTGIEQPTLFNLKYNLTDQLRARTSISSDGEGVGLLEYRMRF